MTIIDWLATSGHRLSTGAANASGNLRVLLPGTNTQTTVFDAAGETLTQPIELDAGGRATVYTDEPVDLAFENADGAAVATVSYGNVHDAKSLLIENDAITGTLPSGSQGAGGRAYLDDALTSLLTSFGATDFQVKESANATARGLAATLFGIQIPAKGFGARGDGLTVDTSAIQLAINRCSALGGGRVYLDPGTYLIDAALTLPASVSLIGAGSAASIIKQTNATANGILVSAAGVGNNLIQGIGISHSSTSTGSAISCLSTTKIVIRDVSVATALFAKAVLFDACGTTAIYDSFLGCTSAAASRSLKYATSGSNHYVTNTTFSAGAGICVECDTSASSIAIIGDIFAAGLVGVKITSDDNNDQIRVIGCTGLSSNVSTPFTAGVAPASRCLYQVGNGVEGATTVVLTGAACTPSPILAGRVVRLEATTGAGTVTVNALAVNPINRGFQMMVEFYNHAGGAVTWSLNAMYHVSTTIPTTDTHIISVLFEWDGVVMRERSRADTT